MRCDDLYRKDKEGRGVINDLINKLPFNTLKLLNENVEEFITRESKCNSVTALSDAKLLWAIPLLLSPSALNFYRVEESAWKSWQQAVYALRENFSDEMYEERVMDEIRACTQGKNELVFDYITLMRLLFSKIPNRLDENT